MKTNNEFNNNLKKGIVMLHIHNSLHQNGDS